MTKKGENTSRDASMEKMFLDHETGFPPCHHKQKPRANPVLKHKAVSYFVCIISNYKLLKNSEGGDS